MILLETFAPIFPAREYKNSRSSVFFLACPLSFRRDLPFNRRPHNFEVCILPALSACDAQVGMKDLPLIFLQNIKLTIVGRLLPATLSDGKLFEPIHAFPCDGRQMLLARPQYLQNVNFSPARYDLACEAGGSLSNLARWRKAGLNL